MLKPYKDCCHVTVRYGNADTLGSDGGGGGQLDLAVLNMSPDLHRLPLALLLLAADKGNDIIYHLRPGLKGLTGAEIA